VSNLVIFKSIKRMFTKQG